MFFKRHFRSSNLEINAILIFFSSRSPAQGALCCFKINLKLREIQFLLKYQFSLMFVLAKVDIVIWKKKNKQKKKINEKRK